MNRPSVVAGVLLALLGCAPPPALKPAPGGETESYLKPAPRPGELSAKDRRRFDEAWARLEQGRWSEASKHLRSLARAKAATPAVATASAYCTLRSGRYEEAGNQFNTVLATGPPTASALVGAALAAIRSGRRADALEPLRRASSLEPDSALVRGLQAETKVQLAENRVATARAAAEKGELDIASDHYEQALAVAPEIAGVRLELAEVFLSRQMPERAAEVLSADPVGDRAVRLRLGQVLAGLLEFDRAIAVYQSVLAAVRDDQDARRGIAEALRNKELLALPDELRRLPSANRLTRADLAALIVLRIEPLGSLPAGEPAVAVDISGSWAREQIVRVLALRILEVYPNHTFQPGGAVSRGDLATALSRVLDLLGVESPAPPLILSDVPRNSLQHDAVIRVVGLGLMDATSSQGGFEPWRAVSGREAWDIVETLARRLKRASPLSDAGSVPHSSRR